LVGMRAPDRKATAERPLSFEFAIMVGGFVSNDPSHSRLYEARNSFDLPSVHIIGRSDFVVRSSDSHDLASRFVNPLVLEHDGGHVVAATPEICASVAAFLAIGSRTYSSGSPDDRRRTPLE
jgi:Serine hydrolase (FSH1)